MLRPIRGRARLHGARVERCRRSAGAAALVLCVALSGGCKAVDQVHCNLDHSNLALAPGDLELHGVGFLTPAAATGREADKQALAHVFAKELRLARPKVKVMSLPAILSAVNAAHLDQDYKRMYRDYLETGILDRAVLRRVGEVGEVRYLVQLSLADFTQQSRGRFGLLGVRLFETKIANLRVFIQIWDSETGGVAWEGSGELNYAYESAAENAAPLVDTATLAARRMYEELALSRPR